MKLKKFIKSVIRVGVSYGFKLLASVSIGILIPIVFSKENYGFYRVYTLYLTYFGLLHFGFVDGVYLIFGGKDLDELNVNKFRNYSKFFYVLEFCASIILFLISIFFLEGERQTIFIFLAINVFALNITSYLQHIAQITSEFKKYSIGNIIYSIMVIVAVGAIFVLKLDTYKYLLGFLVIINYFVLMYYLFTFKSLTLGKSTTYVGFKGEIKTIFKLGIPLLIANWLTVFMINFPKQVVDLFFDVETLGVFSFSYSLMNIATIFVTAISTVVYPTLRKIPKQKLGLYYNDSISIVMVTVSASLLLYFPLDWFVNIYLDKYIDSLVILRIIFPGLIITSAIQIVKLNYFKSLSKLKTYLYTGIFASISTITLVLIFYLVFGTIEMIAIASVLSIVVWYIITEKIFYRMYKHNIIKNMLYLIIIISSFYIITSFTNILTGFIIYILIYFIVSTLFHKSTVVKYIKRKDAT